METTATTTNSNNSGDQAAASTAPEASQATSNASAQAGQENPQAQESSSSEVNQSNPATDAAASVREKLRAERKALEIKQAVEAEKKQLMQEIEAERKKIQEERQKFSKWEKWQKDIEAGKYRSFMDDNGILLEKVYQQYVDLGASAAEKEAIKEALAPLEEEVKMLKQIEETRKKEQDAWRQSEEERHAQLIRDEVKKRIEFRPEANSPEGSVAEAKYELLQAYPDKEELVLRLLVEDDRGPRKFQTYDDAIQAAEDLLYEEEVKSRVHLFKTKKARSLLVEEIDINQAPSNADSSEDDSSADEVNSVLPVKKDTSKAKRKVFKNKPVERDSVADYQQALRDRRQAFEQRRRELEEQFKRR